MKQRGIGDRLSLLTRGMGRPEGTRAPGRQIALWERSGRSLRGCGLEPRDQVVEPELLEPLTHRLELRRGELDQALALGAELERLAQAGLVRVKPADDLLEPLHRGLVRVFCGGCHCSSSVLARTTPSASRASNVCASRSAAAVMRGSPPSSTSS